VALVLYLLLTVPPHLLPVAAAGGAVAAAASAASAAGSSEGQSKVVEVVCGATSSDVALTLSNLKPGSAGGVAACLLAAGASNGAVTIKSLVPDMVISSIQVAYHEAGAGGQLVAQASGTAAKTIRTNAQVAKVAPLTKGANTLEVWSTGLASLSFPRLAPTVKLSLRPAAGKGALALAGVRVTLVRKPVVDPKGGVARVTPAGAPGAAAAASSASAPGAAAAAVGAPVPGPMVSNDTSGSLGALVSTAGSVDVDAHGRKLLQLGWIKSIVTGTVALTRISRAFTVASVAGQVYQTVYAKLIAGECCWKCCAVLLGI
jgi:hypothetical protein